MLVGVVAGPAPGVLLTRRTAHLRQHSGQVSFPGGRIDPTDASPEAAALREAREEVGLDPGHAEILGRLHDYATGTGYRITPVLALLTQGYVTTASACEVDAIFELPVGHAARSFGAGAAWGDVSRRLAGILGMAAPGAVHLGRYGCDPGASGAAASGWVGLMRSSKEGLLFCKKEAKNF